MKNNMRFLFTIAMLSLYGILLFGCGKTDYNNLDRADSLITRTYTPEEIGWLQLELENRTISYEIFCERFHVECLRKTHQGYYAVLLQNDGRRIFVFMDEQYTVNRMVCGEFMSRERFEAQFSDNTSITITEVFAMDPNTCPMPTNVVLRTAHIVKEGIVLVTYAYRANAEPIVETLTFVDDETLAVQSAALGLERVPYILRIDKQQ